MFKIIEELLENLNRNGFETVCCKTKLDASKFILSNINSGDKVGIGGSMTIKALDIFNEIIEKGGILLDHNAKDLSIEEKMEIMRQQLTSDIFLCSSNAVTMNGELVNVDGVGNRVSAMIFGPKKVIVTIGINKICKDENDAFKRIKKEAAPKNNQRLNTTNPCTKTGYCMDCNSMTRICKAYSVLRRKPNLSDIKIIIINEELGY